MNEKDNVSDKLGWWLIMVDSCRFAPEASRSKMEKRGIEVRGGKVAALKCLLRSE